MELKVEQEQAKASTIVSGVHGASPHIRRVKTRSGQSRGAGISIIEGADIHIFVFWPINFF
jgi:hypothetical protein